MANSGGKSKRHFDLSQIFRHILFALAMGVVGAFASIVLCLSVNFCTGVMEDNRWLLYFLPIFVLLSLVLYRVFKLPFDMTTKKVVDYIRNDNEVPATLAPGIVIGTCLSTLGGASVGKEAGALHMGAALGDLVARPFHLLTTRYAKDELVQEYTDSRHNRIIDDLVHVTDGVPTRAEKLKADIAKKDDHTPSIQPYDEPPLDPKKYPKDEVEQVLEEKVPAKEEQKTPSADSKKPTEKIRREVRRRGMEGYAAACGMAAVFSALFMAPLGSTMFVLEASNFKRSVRKHVLTILLACIVAFLVAKPIGIGDILPAVEFPGLTWHRFGECIVIGAISALAGYVFIKLMDGTQRITKRITQRYWIWLLVGSGLVILLVSLCGWESYMGAGMGLLYEALQGTQPDWGFVIKLLMTAIALGFWFKGGEIMPTFVVGCLLGASCTVITGGDPGYSAAIGMVAYFSAVCRYPVAAVLMGCEIYSWDALPLFIIATFVTTLLSRQAGLYGKSYFSLFGSLSKDIRTQSRLLVPIGSNPAVTKDAAIHTAEHVVEESHSHPADSD